MKINLCTYMNWEFGLGWDYTLLKNLLESWGHEVRGVDIGLHSNESIRGVVEPSDVNIFLEILPDHVINGAKHNWLIPNQEWFHLHWTERTQKHITKVLCKTQEAMRVFTPMVGAERCVRIGFESQDLYDPAIPRKRKFLHVAGGSSSKNTVAVTYAFAKFYDDRWDPDCRQELVLVSRNTNDNNFIRDHKNCKYIEKAGAQELKILMNECIFHIMPSGAEGWGHVIHEGLGCGAVMLTTDFPPMNEYQGCPKQLLVKTPESKPMCAGRIAWVGALQVKEAVDRAARLKPDEIAQIQKEAREAFLLQREQFRQNFKELVDAAAKY
jgi:hypothetical protein